MCVSDVVLDCLIHQQAAHTRFAGRLSTALSGYLDPKRVAICFISSVAAERALICLWFGAGKGDGLQEHWRAWC